MHEIKAKVEQLGNLKTQLMEAVTAQFAKGIECVDTCEAGQVVDMIKDLADAEEKCWKACYYQKIVEAMHEAKEDQEAMMRLQMMSMNPEVSRMGYTPTMMPHDRMMNDIRRAGEDWSRDMKDGARQISDGMERIKPDGRIPSYNHTDGYTHNRRMGYDGEMPKEETVHHALETMRDIWKEADVRLKDKMKNEFLKLAKEMGI